MISCITRGQFEDLKSEFPNCRDDYSGRFMYGKTCLAVVVDGEYEIKHVIDLLAELAIQGIEFEDDEDAEQEDIDELADELRGNMLSDNMGRNLVVYWPRIEVTDQADMPQTSS